MLATIVLDDKLLARAQELTGIDDKSALIYEAIKGLVAHESGRRLALLGGSMPDLEDVPRRRFPAEDEEDT